MAEEKTGKNPVFSKKITSFELKFISQELQSLVGARLQKVYQVAERDFLFDFHVPSAGRKYLRASLPALIFISEKKPAILQNLPRMCALMRKYLEGSILMSVSQQGFDRILRLDFAAKTDEFTLFFEFFSRGNLALCTKEGKILGLVESQEWKDRMLSQGLIYSPPPASRNPALLTSGEFFALVQSSEKEIAAFLATALSLGGLYSEEICARAHVLKSKNSNSLSDKEMDALFASLKSLFSEKPEPVVIYDSDSGKAADAAPIRIQAHSSKEIKSFPSFSSALDDIFGDSIMSQEKGDTEKERILRLISEQEESRNALLAKAALSEEKANAIYSHYSEVNEVLSFLKTELSRASVGDAFEKLKTFKSVKSFDKKERTLTFEFE
jgi:predicted ribosome quality control (RQC) complex YloA/Tae2 family protein